MSKTMGRHQTVIGEFGPKIVNPNEPPCKKDTDQFRPLMLTIKSVVGWSGF